MRIILDTNIWVSFCIGKKLAALRALFERDDIEIFYCRELEQEYQSVVNRPKIKKYITAQQAESVHRLMTTCCHYISNVSEPRIAASIRDPKDLYLLNLAEAVQAHYIISGDSDLTSLKQHRDTEIIDFASAILLLGAK